ncbi:MAG: hypothetical protein ACR2QE_14045 [Acidimicrobiales bacterium]
MKIDRPNRSLPQQPVRPHGARAIALSGAMALLLAACSDSTTGAETGAATAETTDASTTTPQPTSTTAALEAPGAPEFIDLHYWEGFLAEGLSVTAQPRAECDDGAPEAITCAWELAGSMVGTHIGRASEKQSGTSTVHLRRPCELGDAATGYVKVDESTGTITTAWGDELHFENRQRSCMPHSGESPEDLTPTVGSLNTTNNWIITGGTGRFEDASGLMSGASPAFESGFAAITTGTLTVRADLWADELPDGALAYVSGLSVRPLS